MARAKAHLASFESKGSHAPATDIPAKVMSYEEVFQVLIPQVHLPGGGLPPKRGEQRDPRPDLALWMEFLWHTGCRVSQMTGSSCPT